METLVSNPIDVLDRMIEKGEDIYETALNIAIQDEDDMSIKRWRQGDIVLRVHAAYGDGIIEKFATALNVHTSTLKQRRAMSKFYELDTRVSYPNVGYSHYREAMRLKNTDLAIDALNHASENDLPVWKFAEYIDLRLGKEKNESTSIPGTITDVFKRDGACIVEITIGLDDMAVVHSGTDVNLKIKEL